MARYKKDIVAVVAERTNRNILRILSKSEPLRAVDIGNQLQALTGIRFKSTSTLTETLQRLESCGLIERKEHLYALTKKGKARWIVKLLDVLVKERIDSKHCFEE